MRVKFLPLLVILAHWHCNLQATTFKKAVAAALKYNKELEANRIKKKQAKNQLDQALSVMFLPNVEGKIRGGQSRSDQSATQIQSPDAARQLDHYVRNGGGNPNFTWLPNETVHSRSSSTTTSTSVDIAVSQNLFRGFADMNQVKSCKNQLKAAHYLLKYQEQILIKNVLEAFLDMWVGRQTVTAKKKKEDNLKKALDSQNSRLEAGAGTPSEVAEASANYQKAIYERIKAETEFFQAKSKFEKLTGLVPDDNIELPDSKIELPKDLDSFMNATMSKNFQIQQAKFNELSALDAVKIEKGALAPTINLEASVGRNLQKEKFNNSTNSYSLTLEGRFPIFSNSSGGKIAIANSKAEEAQATTQNIIQEAKKDAVINWHNRNAAISMLKAGRATLKNAKLVSENNLEELAMGTKSNTDILTGENTLLDATIDLANARKQKIISEAIISILDGTLDAAAVLKYM
jgi:outer membrane protein